MAFRLLLLQTKTTHFHSEKPGTETRLRRARQLYFEVHHRDSSSLGGLVFTLLSSLAQINTSGSVNSAPEHFVQDLLSSTNIFEIYSQTDLRPENRQSVALPYDWQPPNLLHRHLYPLKTTKSGTMTIHVQWRASSMVLMAEGKTQT